MNRLRRFSQGKEGADGEGDREDQAGKEFLGHGRKSALRKSSPDALDGPIGRRNWWQESC